MARNHVAANLLMLVFVVGGLIMGFAVKQEVFPEVSLDRIQVSVAYPGAGPEEVEEGILLKIEENLTGVDGIKEIKAAAAEGAGTVTTEIEAGEDADRILQDIKSEVDRITTFPEDAEKPVITKLLNRREVISVVLYGNIAERSLRERVEQIRDELLDIPEITQVDLSGVRPYEISIEIPEANLRRHNLTLDQVAQRVRRASLDLPGGMVKTEGGQILIRTKERRYYGPGYSDITVLQNPDGTELKLGDIGRVRDGFEETDEFAWFDGKPAAMIRVYRVGDQKPIEISNIVKDYVEQKKASLPESLNLAVWNDTSEIFQSRMNLLMKNACFGLILVMVTLGLFLEIRLAFWVMLGIPVSFLGTLFLMPAMDASINMISLFAFIMALGIVVDDAIVVGENVYERRRNGTTYLQAAVDGTLEVLSPVVFSVLTTVAAFLPLVFVEGLMGKFIKQIPLAMITILLVSLTECMFILPAHLSHGKRRTGEKGVLRLVEKVRVKASSGLDRFIAGPYRRFVDLCVRNRYATLATAIALLLLSVGIVRGGIIKFVFMPEVDGDVIFASLQMPRGTPIEETSRIQGFLVKKAQEVIKSRDGRKSGNSILRHIYSVVGNKISPGGPGEAQGPTGASHIASVAVFLTPTEERDITASEVANDWRKSVGEIPGADSLTFTSNLVHMGANIDIRLAHEDFGVLAKAAKQLKKSLSEYPGVSDIADNHAIGARELKIRLRPEARTLGVTEEELGRQIRGAFYGAEALRLQRGRNEVKVMVRYPETDRKSLWDLESMRIRPPDGGEIPLEKAAIVSEGSSFSEINRTDRKRVINVTATVDSRTTNAEEILLDMKQTVLADLKADYPGLRFDLEGEEKERRDSMNSMKRGFLLALFGIYALLAVPFRSYSQPFLIMITIPFGIIGALLGHLLMGYNLSMMSMFGVVALAGVVVNDAIVLIDKINSNRREGAGMYQAVVEAGQRRFRPILLTSLTTFFGLVPMITETSVQAKFLIPMAISLGFGVVFATGITLLLIPSIYLILEDLRGLFRRGKQVEGAM